MVARDVAAGHILCVLKRPRLPIRREPRQPRALATRAHILEAASRCLRELGPDASMTRIAEVAGYSIGTLYQYFPDRRSLLCELMHEVCERELHAVMALVPALQGAHVAEVINAVLGVLVTSAAEHRGVIQVLVTDVLPTLEPNALEDLVPTIAPLLAQQLRIRANQMTVRDFDMAARFILVSVEALVHDAAVEHPEWFDEDALLSEVKALVHGYLAVRPESSA